MAHGAGRNRHHGHTSAGQPTGVVVRLQIARNNRHLKRSGQIVESSLQQPRFASARRRHQVDNEDTVISKSLAVMHRQMGVHFKQRALDDDRSRSAVCMSMPMAGYIGLMFTYMIVCMLAIVMMVVMRMTVGVFVPTGDLFNPTRIATTTVFDTF